ncbi:NADH-cytochrome b5 reductase [Pholiota conissans]|uniref:NADH-cytochrome b5 reductase n=1 Tax=Pholiota conissans TaxID=109636 RepID=A0A9P6CXH5_9AGAR|nr:NADH-cytochrome b5 reductase [Pholiota conissans]
MSGPLDPQNFVALKLKKITPYNHNASKFTFELPDNQASNIPIASCIVVKSTDAEALKDGEGKPIIRPYTPISTPDTPGELTLLIKRYEAGNASKHIHSLKVGDSLSVKGPIAKFPYKINEFDEVAFIGGGTGIAPFYQVLTYALGNKENKTKFKLIFSNITEKDILLREELDALKAQFPETFDIVYLVDQPSEQWTGPSGYITAEHIKKYVGAPLTNIKIFVCGPPPQVASLAGAKDGPKQGVFGGILKDLGYTEEQVFKF